MAAIEALAGRMGALSWVSAALFEIEGRWAGEMANPAAVAHLATHSRHHGWHASLWEQALPDSAALNARQHVAAPDGWAAALDVATTFDAGSQVGDVERLTVLYRGLLPRLTGLLADLGDELGGPGDGVISRTLGFVLSDVTADLLGGLRLLSGALVDAEAVEKAAEVSKSLDQAFRTR